METLILKKFKGFAQGHHFGGMAATQVHVFCTQIQHKILLLFFWNEAKMSVDVKFLGLLDFY